MRPRTLLPALTVLLTLPACGSEETAEDTSPPAVTGQPVVPVDRPVDLGDPGGSVLGTAWLRDTDTGGVELELEVSGLPAGLQDVGLHESADCGSVTPEAPVIAVPSLPVGEDGTGALTTDVDGAALEEILGGEGMTVVVTDAGVDAQAGQESGLPDDYLACGSFSD